MTSIDLSCDIGEGFGAYTYGCDEQVMELISSANVACGFHAGDPTIIRKTIERAIKLKISVGAHPGLPDLLGFGKRIMHITKEQAHDYILYQVSAVTGITRSLGSEISHVNLHAAFNRMLSADAVLAESAVKAIKSIDKSLIVVAWHGSELARAAKSAGLKVAYEVILDRGYGDDSQLLPRKNPDAVINSAEKIIMQALNAAQFNKVITNKGKEITFDKVHTLRFHIETTEVSTVKSIVTKLKEQSISIVPLKLLV